VGGGDSGLRGDPESDWPVDWGHRNRLGDDYSIHIIEGLDEERLSSGLERREAAWKALATMGPHLLAGMLTTSVRFGAS
jgi:hypothetical protein